MNSQSILCYLLVLITHLYSLTMRLTGLGSSHAQLKMLHILPEMYIFNV